MARCASGRYFFERVGAHTFAPTDVVQGAWNTAEQHIAPALGLIAHAIEQNLKARRDEPLDLGRISYDILGTIPIGPVTIEVALLRAGRTIELVEARMLYANRPVVVARGWLMRGFDTAQLNGTPFARMPEVEAVPSWDMSAVWDGGCIAAMEVRREKLGIGKARAWLRTDVELLASEEASPTAQALGLVDIANGVTMRMLPDIVAFPNLDLTAHLFRAPSGGWVGFDTTVSVGTGGIGLTSSVLHDVNGPFGTLAQCLTVRPRE